MTLADYVHTFGQDLLKRYGERIHKIAIDAAFTCPNLDGTKGRGGCTFCNNVSFSPNGRQPATIETQIQAGKQVIRKRTGARLFIAYFQAYTNTYTNLETLQTVYESALCDPDIIGLAVGTRPDCVPEAVLALLASYKERGFEVWLELGLQSSFDNTLALVNRGHGFAEYRDAIKAAHAHQLPVCTHLIAGLPGETAKHIHITLDRILNLGVAGIKIHPLHVVKGTQLANQWRRNEYQPLALVDYIKIAADIVERTPAEIIFHRLTATAAQNILLAPDWCAYKWLVLNGIEAELRQRNTCQGAKA